MMKKEFEQLANCTVSPEDYKKIEEVYRYYPAMFPDKDSIILFYHTFGMDGIDRMILEKLAFDELIDNKKDDCYCEERKYLDEHVKAESLRTYASAVLVSLRDMLIRHNENRQQMDIYEAYSLMASCILFLNEKIKKLESGDYAV